MWVFLVNECKTTSAVTFILRPKLLGLLHLRACIFVTGCNCERNPLGSWLTFSERASLSGFFPFLLCLVMRLRCIDQPRETACVCACSVAPSCLTLQPLARQSPGSSVLGFPRREYWRGLHFRLQGSSCLRDQARVSVSPPLVHRFFTTESPGKPMKKPTSLKTRPQILWDKSTVLPKWILSDHRGQEAASPDLKPHSAEQRFRWQTGDVSSNFNERSGLGKLEGAFSSVVFKKTHYRLW